VHCQIPVVGGDVVELPLTDARVEELVSAPPWRGLRWRKGQRHYSGLWWSSIMAAHVGYESRLELARLILADFDPSVRMIVSQPFLIEADRDGRRRRPSRHTANQWPSTLGNRSPRPPRCSATPTSSNSAPSTTSPPNSA
jgi:hypothetical protein